MKSRNNKGPNAVPWGTPDVTGGSCRCFSVMHHSLLPVIKEVIYPFKEFTSNAVEVKPLKWNLIKSFRKVQQYHVGLFLVLDALDKVLNSEYAL